MTEIEGKVLGENKIGKGQEKWYARMRGERIKGYDLLQDREVVGVQDVEI